MTEFTISGTVPAPFDATVDRVRDLLAGAGFGVLTEIDVAATLQAKLDVTIPAKLILGACRPQLAHQMLAVDSRLAALLPCNVVITEDGDRTLVEVVDPMAMAALADDVAAQAIAREARCRLASVIDGLVEEAPHAIGA